MVKIEASVTIHSSGVRKGKDSVEEGNFYSFLRSTYSLHNVFKGTLL